MIERYDPEQIERKWQKIWADSHCFEAEASHEKPKFFGLIEFPYPSGQGLHVGHPRPFTAMDVISRKRRMQGYNVLFPIGYDAFGLPTENYAIKTGIHPSIVTHDNIARFRTQLQRLGYSFDYSREVNTTDPLYYKWTQWIFLKFYEKGLAYKAEIPINFCTSCKVGLANEEVVDGVCERCGGQVVRKVRSQWMLKITAYADRLIDDLDGLDFIDKVKTQQINWIGRSTGAQVLFPIQGSAEGLMVYTTRPDTLFGATYMVVAPEHPIVEKMRSRITNMDEVEAYRKSAATKSDFERSELVKDKTGVELKGLRAVNPVTGKEIPVWISDYVLMGYGTGAIMAVPAHDERDYAFAKTFGLPIVEVVAGGDIEKEAYTDCESGVMVNSGFLNGLQVPEAKEKIIEWLENQGVGEKKTNFKLRDWVFSRQRYWGEPIPLVYCEHCGGWVPLPYDQLPLELPKLDDFTPTDDGSSCLARAKDWLHTTCPKCGGPAIREADTMPNWAGSSWYFLRYADAHNDSAFASPEELKYWLPVDWYNGGMEHTTLHLLYSRFWHKFLYDCGLVPTKEPYQKRTSHGMVLGENGEKMSKSRGNVVNPDDYVNEFGADAFRMYIMFMGAFDQPIPWNTQGTRGCRKFLDRVWRLYDMIEGEGESADMRGKVHGCIKKVSEDIERMKFNTAIAAMMTLVNDFYAKGKVTRDEFVTLLKLLSPFAPHLSEELNERLGNKEPLHHASWPVYDEAALVAETVEYGVQVNGKVRGRVALDASLDKEAVEQAALAIPDVAQQLVGKTVKKIIVVKNIVNIVAG